MAVDAIVARIGAPQTDADDDEYFIANLRTDLQDLSAELQGALWSAMTGGAGEECRHRLELAAQIALDIAGHYAHRGDPLLCEAARLLGAFLDGRTCLCETDMEIARGLVLVMETAASRHRPSEQFELRAIADRQIELIRQMIDEALANK